MVEFKVDGMSCQGCINSITKAMLAADANSQVKVDLEKQLVRVQSHKDSEALKAVIEDAGFAVTETRLIA